MLMTIRVSSRLLLVTVLMAGLEKYLLKLVIVQNLLVHRFLLPRVTRLIKLLPGVMFLFHLVLVGKEAMC